MSDFITTLTAAAISMCAGLCSPIDRIEVYMSDGTVGLVERYFLDPKSPVLALHPESRFDFARDCFTTINGLSDGYRGPLRYCESWHVASGQDLGLTWWEAMPDHEGECIMVAQSTLEPEWFIEHFVCRERGVS